MSEPAPCADGRHKPHSILRWRCEECLALLCEKCAKTADRCSCPVFDRVANYNLVQMERLLEATRRDVEAHEGWTFVGVDGGNTWRARGVVKGRKVEVRAASRGELLHKVKEALGLAQPEPRQGVLL